MKQQTHAKGQSLVEAVVTLGVVILLVSGLVVGSTLSLGRADNSKSRSLATTYAQEGLELARKERDAGWSQFVSVRSGRFCVDEGAIVDGTTPCPLVNGAFYRELVFTPGTEVPVETMSITSTVSWYQGNQEVFVTLETQLTDWK